MFTANCARKRLMIRLIRGQLFAFYGHMVTITAGHQLHHIIKIYIFPILISSLLYWFSFIHETAIKTFSLSKSIFDRFKLLFKYIYRRVSLYNIKRIACYSSELVELGLRSTFFRVKSISRIYSCFSPQTHF